MSEGNAPSTTITSHLQIGAIEHGQATGVAIGVMNVSGNAYLAARLPEAYADEVTLEIIRTYLQPAAEMASPPADASPELRKLWGKPFRAQGGSAEPAADLCDAVEAVFNQAKQRGGFQRVVLLGESGAGKTPALKHYLLARIARKALASLPGEGSDQRPSPDADRLIIPIYVSLTTLRDDRRLENLLCDGFNAVLAPVSARRISADAVTGLLARGAWRCTLMLDDLEELLSQEGGDGLQALSRFMELYPSHRYVIACRTPSCGQQLGQLDRLYLDNLSEEEAQDVLKDLLDTQAYDRLSQNSQRLLRNRGNLKTILGHGLSAEVLQTKGLLRQVTIQRQFEKDKGTYADYHVTLAVARSVLARLAITMRLAHANALGDREIMRVITDYMQEWQEPCRWHGVAEALRETGMLARDEERCQWRFRDRAAEEYFRVRTGKGTSQRKSTPWAQVGTAQSARGVSPGLDKPGRRERRLAASGPARSQPLRARLCRGRHRTPRPDRRAEGPRGAAGTRERSVRAAQGR